MTSFPSIQLLPSQQAHFERIDNIVKIWHAWIDTSPTGSGKTLITLKMAQKYQLQIFLVAPPTVIPNWYNESQKYNIPILFSISYDKLKTCHHPYLEKLEGTKEFRATSEFRKLLHEKNGILLIFDEFQMAKNWMTSRTRACHALVLQLIQENQRYSSPTSITSSQSEEKITNSRIAVISALPGDKEEHITSLYQLSGIITYPFLYYYDRSQGIYQETGMEEIKNFCHHFCREDYQYYLPQIPLTTKKTAGSVALNLYDRFVKKIVSSSMSKLRVFSHVEGNSLEVNANEIIPDAKNGYYILLPKDLERLNEGQMLLRMAHHIRSNAHQQLEMLEGEAPLIGKCQTALIMMESAKINTLARLSRQNLLNNPHNKVIVYLNYIANIEKLSLLLQDFHPQVLYGETKLNHRTELVNKFNQPNDELRILICGITIGGLGINLHDTNGNYPRTSFIVPSYYFSRCHQAAGRIFRQGVKSQPVIRYVYAKQVQVETKILDLIIRKGQVGKKMISDEESNLFPGDYPVEIEEDPQPSTSE